jgi:hypothetical protein
MADNLKKAQAESTLELARRSWIRGRIEQIHRNVSAFEVLQRRGNIDLNSTSGREEQFSCPFHGMDRKPSARIYPESARSPSHVWCFVCQERWDAIALWRKFNGDGDDTPFTKTITQIEHAYGLVRPEMPQEMIGSETGEAPVSKELVAFDALHDVCESRLKLARPAYRKLGDLVGYLSASSILDKIRYRVEQRQVTPEMGSRILRQLLEKIGGKVQACPDV